MCFNNPSRQGLQVVVALVHVERLSGEKPAMIQWNSGYAKRKLKCHGDFYTLSQGFVWITILLFNQLAECWVAYFRAVYFSANDKQRPGDERMHACMHKRCMLQHNNIPTYIRASADGTFGRGDLSVCPLVCGCARVHDLQS